MWALLTIFGGSTIYLLYNVQILRHPEWYATHDLYYWGDVAYAANGWFYLLASLRDDGWLFFMPLAGGFPCPASQALLYRIVHRAEKKQRIQEVLARLEADEQVGGKGEGDEEHGGGGGLASAVVALLAADEQAVAAVGYDVI